MVAMKVLDLQIVVEAEEEALRLLRRLPWHLPVP